MRGKQAKILSDDNFDDLLLSASIAFSFGGSAWGAPPHPVCWKVQPHKLRQWMQAGIKLILLFFKSSSDQARPKGVAYRSRDKRRRCIGSTQSGSINGFFELDDRVR
jgi:hypothetical protein